MNILVTGAAGFIGNAVAIALLQRGDTVIGIDNMNDYYSVELKNARLKRICLNQDFQDFRIFKIDVCDKSKLIEVFDDNKIDAVVHLAAQAGVRYSLENPQAYIDSNIVGTLNIFECCRNFGVKNIVYASSSSVYGDNAKIPFSTDDRTDNPVSLYAATKKSCELMAHTYSHLFDLNMAGLRYFTVYGPWGRPDMAPILFAKNILEGKPIKVFNNGNMKRDFTYIDDIVNGTIAVLDWGGRGIFNIGRGEPVDLMRFIEILECELGKPAIKEFLPMQPGDVPVTWADTIALEKATGYCPKISLEEGIKHFARWYLNYYI
ncbi:MAG: NAD-dependent epimerase/dehydratase family protein [Fibromonadales bacterium]|nr:NAD-dependent epimerase/dehydratase family protein [Fibromonadales bacterium]